MKTFKTNGVVAAELEINDSTLRKYVKLLEDFNYPIKKNLQGRRLYSDEDIVKIKEFIELVYVKKCSLVKAAELVTIEYQKESLEIILDKLIIKVENIDSRLKSLEQL